MNTSTCPKCHKPGVHERPSKNGGTHLANMETYPSGISYFRSLHTTEECAKYLHSNDPGAATVWTALTGLRGAAAILHAEYVRDHPTTTHTAPF